ncbi:MAG: hypothetical protein KI790_02055 [Cyclobacteriaceae bacterium]|nr:hypothetical protein [Cyclobacteriaceae bacterium HetDA_MAG_MS6]
MKKVLFAAVVLAAAALASLNVSVKTEASDSETISLESLEFMKAAQAEEYWGWKR